MSENWQRRIARFITGTGQGLLIFVALDIATDLPDQRAAVTAVLLIWIRELMIIESELRA